MSGSVLVTAAGVCVQCGVLWCPAPDMSLLIFSKVPFLSTKPPLSREEVHLEWCVVWLCVCVRFLCDAPV